MRNMNSRIPRRYVGRSLVLGLALAAAACGGNGGETSANQPAANTTAAPAEAPAPSTTSNVGRAVLKLNSYDKNELKIETYSGVTTAAEDFKPARTYLSGEQRIIDCQVIGRPLTRIYPNEEPRPEELKGKETLWFKLLDVPGHEFARAWYADPVEGLSATYPRQCTALDMQR